MGISGNAVSSERLEGSLALSSAFASEPLMAVQRPDADICTWSTNVDVYEHIEVPDMLIGLLTKGDVQWQTRNGRGGGSCRRGRVTVIPANIRLRFEPNGPLMATTVHISPNRIRQLMKVEDGDALLEAVNLRMGEDEPLMASALLELVQEIADPSQRGSLLTDSIIDVLVHKALKRAPLRPEAPKRRCGLSPHMLRRVTDYVHGALNTPLGLRELSDLVGLEQHYFCKMFKQSTGSTPHQFVTQVRVERCKDLLRTPASISEIAYDIGFASHSHLCDTFRKFTGQSPTEFRREALSR